MVFMVSKACIQTTCIDHYLMSIFTARMFSKWFFDVMQSVIPFAFMLLWR